MQKPSKAKIALDIVYKLSNVECSKKEYDMVENSYKLLKKFLIKCRNHQKKSSTN